MQLDLNTLRVRHPLLPISTALEYVHRAALGLQRGGHQPDCRVSLEIEGDPVTNGTLRWQSVDLAGLAQLDHLKVTEDSAEAISLILVNEAQRWSIERRLQRFESADWLLRRTEDGREETLALEISGVAEGEIGARLREKLEQVSACALAEHRAASVVGLLPPALIYRRTGDEQ